MNHGTMLPRCTWLQAERQLAYCEGRGISVTSLMPCIERSEVTLPPLAAREITADTWFDVGIIDGGQPSIQRMSRRDAPPRAEV